MSIVSMAKDYLLSSKNDVVLQNELVKEISVNGGYAMESVRGKLFGSFNSLLASQDWFKNKWVVCRKPTRFIRKDTALYELEKVNIDKINYDTASKQATRERVFSHLSRLGKAEPTILTMASSQGLCVKHVLNQFPKARIYNAEKEPDVLAEFNKLNLPVTSYNKMIGDVLKDDIKEKLDFIFYDSMYGLCRYIYNDLLLINKQRKTKLLAVCLQDIKKVRNHGKFTNWAKEHFYKYDDPTKAILRFILCRDARHGNNYRLIDEFSYKKEAGTRSMRVLVFEELND